MGDGEGPLPEDGPYDGAGLGGATAKVRAPVHNLKSRRGTPMVHPILVNLGGRLYMAPQIKSRLEKALVALVQYPWTCPQQALIMIEPILIPFVVVALAEIGDKTQLSILLLSTRTEEHLRLFLGVTLAFLIVDGTAVYAGSWIVNTVSVALLKLFSGFIFIIFGILTLKNSGMRTEDKFYFKNSFFSGFTLVFITEWGDKTQIASGLFATRYDTLMVLVGTMAALTLLSAMAIYMGKFVSYAVDRKGVTMVAGAVFILMGITFFLL